MTPGRTPELDMLVARRARMVRELALLDEAIAVVRKLSASDVDDAATSAGASLVDHKYLGWRLKDAIIDCLAEKEEEELNTIISQLLAHGAYLGKHDTRYATVVKISITQNPGELGMNGDKVVLKKRKLT